MNTDNHMQLSSSDNLNSDNQGSIETNNLVNPSASLSHGNIKTGGALQSKNVRIHKRRTSVRLEPEMWNALNEIAALEGCSIHDLCGAVHDLKDPEASFTAALRVFMMEYYRTAARTTGQVTQVQKKIQINQAAESKSSYKKKPPKI